MSIEYKKLDQVCEILDSRRIPITASDRKSGIYPYFGANGLQDYVDDYIFDDELVLLAEDGGNFGSKDRPIAYRVSGKCWVNNHAHVLKAKDEINIDYLCYSLMFYNTNGLVNGATRQKLTQAAMRQMLIPVRSMPEQLQIVKRIRSIFDLINDRTSELLLLDQLVKSRFIELFGEINAPSKWEKKPWAELVTIQNGRDYKHIAVESGGYAVYGTGGEMARASDYLCPENTIIVGRKGTINNPLLVKEKFWNVDTAFGVIVGEQLHYQYFYGFCRMFDFSTLNKQAVLPSTTKADLLKIQIAVPPIELQEQFAAFVEQVDKSKFYIQQIDEIYLLIIKTLSWRVKHDYN